MPKNKGKGGKNRRRGKNANEEEKRELNLKEDGQEYAQVSHTTRQRTRTRHCAGCCPCVSAAREDHQHKEWVERM